MEQNSASYNTFKNSAYSFLGYALPMVFSILITPVLVKKLGVQDFGIYVLLNTITGFLNLIDLGLGISIVKHASEYRARNEESKLHRLVGSVNLLFLTFGLVGLLVYVAVGKFFLSVFHIPPVQQANILPVFIMAGAVFLIGALSNVPNSLLKAWQRYDLTVKVTLAHLTAFNVAALVLALMGFKLKMIYAAAGAVTFLSWALYVFWTRRATGLRLLHFDWHWEEVKRCYRFGVAAFVTNLANNALSQLDRLVIPVYLSPVQLSYYSLPGNVAEKINGVSGTSTNVLFPMLSSLVASGQKEQITRLYEKVFRNIIVLAAAMSFCAALFAHKILYFWIGPEVAEQGAGVLVILAATNGILSIYSVLNNFLLGFGKVRFLMKASLVMSVINVVFLLWWVPHYQIRGAAWAYLVSVLPVIVIIFLVERRFLGLTGRAMFYAKLIGKLAVTSLAFYTVYFFILNPLVRNIASLIVVGSLSVVVFLAFYKLFGFLDEEDWQAYKGFFWRILLKLGLGNKTI